MMDGEMPRIMMAIMGLFWFLLLLVMVLGIVALIKYLRGK